MKYILVSGGVISSVGKGIVTSSVGILIKSLGLHVTAIKIDPYLNIDAGTFSPYEHGETFVLNDGGEVDLDLGNYERFLNVTLSKNNNITTGKVYQSVINKERNGQYLGKTVQVVPHITEEISNWVERQSKVPVDGSDIEPDVCVIELGGTIGDIESMAFVEAMRQLKFKSGESNFINIHVSMIPETSGGEFKTKPTQASVRELRGLGLVPDFLVGRSKTCIDEGLKAKMSMLCSVEKDHVLNVQDCDTTYLVPLLLKKQRLDEMIIEIFDLQDKISSTQERKIFMKQWEMVARNARFMHGTKEVKIAMVGKYVKQSDAYLSVNKALRHAAIHCGVNLQILHIEAEDLEEVSKNEEDQTKSVNYHKAWASFYEADGVLVPGGFGVRGLSGKILACKHAREHNIPLLGICLGLQSIVIEFCRNVLGFADANSTEFDANTSYPCVIDMPEHNQGKMGGTMRLGLRTSIFTDTVEQDTKQDQRSKLRQLYAKSQNQTYEQTTSFDERHRHRYEVNPEKIEEIQTSQNNKTGKYLKFTAKDDTQTRMEAVELVNHPFYMGLQAHPEFLSRPMKPSPAYLGLILACLGKDKLERYLETGKIDDFHDEGRLLDQMLENSNGSERTKSLDASRD